MSSSILGLVSNRGLSQKRRKTGVQVAPVERDANGFEGVSNFFASSPASAAATTPRAVAQQSARKAPSSAVRVPSGLGKYGSGAVEQVDEPDWNVDYGGGGDDEEEGGQTQDMDVDDGAWISFFVVLVAQS